jgi:hypothetical protein
VTAGASTESVVLVLFGWKLAGRLGPGTGARILKTFLQKMAEIFAIYTRNIVKGAKFKALFYCEKRS